MKIIYFFTMLCLCLNSCAQDLISGYEIDNSVIELIQEKTNSKALYKSVIEFKLFENDSLIIDSGSKKRPVESLTRSYYNGDTLVIQGWLGMFSGLGFIIKIIDEECEIIHFLSFETPAYKLKLSDSLTARLIVPCVKSKLTLSEKPVFNDKVKYSGVVYLESDDYYTVDKGETKKTKIELTSYFTAMSSENLLKEIKENGPSKPDKIDVIGE